MRNSVASNASSNANNGPSEWSRRMVATTGMPVHSRPITQDYQISRNVLGVGISGRVVECEHRTTGQIYALKVLRDSPKARREVELHAMASTHPNVVKVLDIYENTYNDTRCLLVVMECMRGGELFAAIQERAATAFTEREAAAIMHAVCSAVAHLHSLGIAHRDLKPENLLYTVKGAQGLLKLTDFGFAKRVVGDSERLMSSCYTPYYAAPEVLGSGHYDKSCDLWAIGVITYILLCGFPPFFSQHGLPMSPGMKSRIRAGQYSFPSPEWDRVSDSAKDLIQKLLRTDPASRPTISEVMDHEWITDHRRVPDTPLCTVDVLADEKDTWSEMQEEMEITLAAMRVEEVRVKSLADANNRLLLKRRAKSKVSSQEENAEQEETKKNVPPPPPPISMDTVAEQAS